MQNYAFAHGGATRGPRREGPKEEGYVRVALGQFALYTDIIDDQLPPIAPLTHYPASSPNTSTSQIPDKGRPTYGVDLSEQMERDNVDVPPIIIKCCEAIEKYGLTFQGIYRVGGTITKVKELRERLDKGLSGTYFA